MPQSRRRMPRHLTRSLLTATKRRALMSNPVTDDAHQIEPGRFFRDGEEPPERYDREDELDYLINDDFPVALSDWLKSARTGYRTFLRQSVRYCSGYILVWLIGWHMVLGLVLIFLEPLFLIPLTRRAIIQLSGGLIPKR